MGKVLMAERGYFLEKDKETMDTIILLIKNIERIDGVINTMPHLNKNHNIVDLLYEEREIAYKFLSNYILKYKMSDTKECDLCGNTLINPSGIINGGTIRQITRTDGTIETYCSECEDKWFMDFCMTKEVANG